MAEERPNMDVVDAILELKARDPFMPFNIVLTSGDKFLIERGENLVEMRTEFFYATPGGERFAFIRKRRTVARPTSLLATILTTSLSGDRTKSKHAFQSSMRGLNRRTGSSPGSSCTA